MKSNVKKWEKNKMKKKKTNKVECCNRMLIVENEYWILKSNAEFRYLNNVCWKFNNECLKRILNILKRMLYVDMLNFEKKNERENEIYWTLMLKKEILNIE